MSFKFCKLSNQHSHFSVSLLLLLLRREVKCPSCGDSKWVCKRNVWQCHGASRELVHSETKQSQRCRLNSLQLGGFYLTCWLAPTFTLFTDLDNGKEKKTNHFKKGLGKHFFFSFLKLISSPAPLLITLLMSYYLSFVPHCTQPLDVAMGGLG